MRTAHSWKAGAVIVVALVAGCASPPRAERSGPVPVGSVWVNQARSSGSYGTGTTEIESRAVTLVRDGRNLLGVQTPEGTLMLQPSSGDWLGMIGKDNKLVVSWDPPLAYDWPLEVGKSWTKQYTVKFHAQDRTVPFEARQTVEAHEEVTVPAGTFKTFRVRYTDTLGNVNVDWYSPELRIFVKRSMERTAKHSQGPGRRETELKSTSMPK
jgi:hypothetical protein